MKGYLHNYVHCSFNYSNETSLQRFLKTFGGKKITKECIYFNLLLVVAEK